MIPRPLLVGVVMIAAIWLVVVVVLRLTEGFTSTPEKVAGLMDAMPWSEVGEGSAAERQAYLARVIDEMNRLNFEQRRLLRENHDASGQRFFNSLTAEEKGQFLESTVEQHFKSIMKAFNQMSPEERASAVERARADLRNDEVDGENVQRLKAEDEQVFEKLVEKGLGAYYEEANADTKLDLAPLLEEMQQRLRSLPGRR